MRFVSWKKNGTQGLAVRRGKDLVRLDGPSGQNLDMLGLLRAGKDGLERAAAQAASAPVLDLNGLEYLPPLADPPKIVCVGMNYQDHADENKLPPQEYPTFFVRFTSSLLGHEQPMLRPHISDTLDFEGELAVIIGKPGRYISKEQALDHVWGYALFNNGSVREFQGRGKQWTLGKNFDKTGGFGPELVTADELPGRPRPAPGNASERNRGAIGQYVRFDFRYSDVDLAAQRSGVA